MNVIDPCKIYEVEYIITNKKYSTGQIYINIQTIKLVTQTSHGTYTVQYNAMVTHFMQELYYAFVPAIAITVTAT